MIGLLSSGCGTAQQGPQLSTAVLLIHLRVQRQGAAALLGHQQLIHYFNFVFNISDCS